MLWRSSCPGRQADVYTVLTVHTYRRPKRAGMHGTPQRSESGTKKMRFMCDVKDIQDFRNRIIIK